VALGAFAARDCFYGDGLFAEDVGDAVLAANSARSSAVADIVVRLEHLSFSQCMRGREPDDVQSWFVPAVIVAETVQPSTRAAISRDVSSEFERTRVMQMLDAASLQFRLARTTTSIADLLAFANTSLTSFDTAGLEHVTSLGSRFLADARALTSIDCSGLRSVTTISDGFLEGCAALGAFDTSTGFTSVTLIGSSFLAEARSLAAFDASGLSAVVDIGDAFLRGTLALRHFDTSDMVRLRSVGARCLAGASLAGNGIDLSGWASLTSLGERFLSESHLTCLDIAGLGALQHLDRFFIHNCPQLTAVSIAGLNACTAIARGAFTRCDSLTRIALTGMSAVTTIDALFVFGNESLTSVDLSGLTSLTKVGRHPLDANARLPSVDFGPVAAAVPPCHGLSPEACEYAVVVWADAAQAKATSAAATLVEGLVIDAS